MRLRHGSTLLVPVLALLAPALATASDPGRWKQVRRSPIPLVYYQGVTADPARNLYFDGVYVGLFRTGPTLVQKAGVGDVIPEAVKKAEGYNHIGDISWDVRKGGRVLLPMECYYPGTPGNANTCGTGSIGVADPATLRWRYYVKLDPAQIPKAMWCEVAPDGRLLWTSSGDDLIAYDLRQVTAANAAPDGPLLRPVRRLANAVPPSGVTGATFVGSRLYVAGTQGDTTMQVWSIDLRDGSRRLEIERKIVGESEGLVTSSVLGGVLHWIITPFTTSGRPPTFGPTGNQLLSFVPKASKHLTLAASPRRLAAGIRTRVRFTVRRRVGGDPEPVEGAVVTLAGRRAATDPDGATSIRVTLPPGRYHATATLAGTRRARATIRVRAGVPAFTGAVRRTPR